MTFAIRQSAARGGAWTFLALALAVVVFTALPQGGGAAIAGSGVPAGLAPALARTADSAPARSVEVIVQMQATARRHTGRALVRAEGGEVIGDLHIIRAVAARMPAAAAVRLARDPRVRAVSLNATVEPQGVSTRRLKSAYTASIRAEDVRRGRNPITGRGVGVAVIDTGVAGNLRDFTVSRTNRTSRVRHAVSVNPHATTVRDTHGHGTHIAGIIAGDGRNRRWRDQRRANYIGVAPDARIISVKIADDHGRATTLDAIYGIQFAVDNAEALGIRVVNLSLSSTQAESYRTDPLAAAAEAAWLNGLVVVAAAGNDGMTKAAVEHAPGNDPYVITVGATDDQGTRPVHDDRRAPWSSWGRSQDGIVKPDVLAPGAHIVSTLAPGSDFADLCPACVVHDHYFQAGGTSMAAAVVSGAVALLLERHPDWTPDQVKEALVRMGDEIKGAGVSVRVDKSMQFAPDPVRSRQQYPLNQLIDAATGDIDYSAASWRAASWRLLDRSDPSSADWAAASWRCDCSLAGDGSVDPQAASWRAASWRTWFDR